MKVRVFQIMRDIGVILFFNLILFNNDYIVR